MINGNGTEASTFTNAEGKFSILGLNPGSYTVSIIPDESYSPQTITDVVVEEDKITVIPTITLVQP